MNFFSTFVASTAFKYLVTMVATFLAAKLGLEQGNLEAILTQAVALIMLCWGAFESAKNKIVINGEKASIPDNIAATTTAQTAKDVLIGRVR